MYFESLSALLHMDGHGAFVWSAYAISALVIALCIAQPLLRYRLELKRLAAQQSALSPQTNRSAASQERQ